MPEFFGILEYIGQLRTSLGYTGLSDYGIRLMVWYTQQLFQLYGQLCYLRDNCSCLHCSIVKQFLQCPIPPNFMTAFTQIVTAWHAATTSVVTKQQLYRMQQPPRWQKNSNCTALSNYLSSTNSNCMACSNHLSSHVATTSVVTKQHASIINSTQQNQIGNYMGISK